MDRAERKAELRATMRARRDEVPGEERLRRADRIAGRITALGAFRAARTVLLFYSFGSEASTLPIARRVHEEGKRLLLPFLRDGTMEAAEVSPGEALTASRYGPKEPSKRIAVDPREVDLVITPGLAFDRDGRRLGYGGGHYDRYLTRLRDDTLRVGLAFAFQVVDEVPSEDHDERVHVVVTEDDAIEASII
ncbi:MAG TPA: 5-formyltetrahydrofolate cyclo-ligase [Actinomycetota bacterium]|nr:5-formyltetrahydrofolate cyclo-ligase [Actinomycetota bacterium]